MEDRKLKNKIESLVKQANFDLRGDVYALIDKAYRKETKKLAKKALGWILDNAHKAQKEQIALCQDTGLPMVFIEVGKNRAISYPFINTISKGIESGYKKHYLRASIVDPLVRNKSGYKGVEIYTTFNPKINGIKLTLLVKGFGSENKSQLKMFNPTSSMKDIEDFIIDSVESAGPESCPPFIVGVGIGGTSDYALILSKKVLTDNLNKAHKNRSIRQLESRLFTRINRLNIGAMGFGGKNTVLAVKAIKAPTHIAGLPVGVNVSCWALRSASIKI